MLISVKGELKKKRNFEEFLDEYSDDVEYRFFIEDEDSPILYAFQADEEVVYELIESYLFDALNNMVRGSIDYDENVVFALALKRIKEKYKNLKITEKEAKNILIHKYLGDYSVDYGEDSIKELYCDEDFIEECVRSSGTVKVNEDCSSYIEYKELCDSIISFLQSEMKEKNVSELQEIISVINSTFEDEKIKSSIDKILEELEYVYAEKNEKLKMKLHDNIDVEEIFHLQEINFTMEELFNEINPEELNEYFRSKDIEDEETEKFIKDFKKLIDNFGKKEDDTKYTNEEIVNFIVNKHRVPISLNTLDEYSNPLFDLDSDDFDDLVFEVKGRRF